MKSKTKTVFYEQTCSDCDFLKIQGCFPCETRYCTNFPRKRAKRFRSKDPIYKRLRGGPNGSNRRSSGCTGSLMVSGELWSWICCRI